MSAADWRIEVGDRVLLEKTAASLGVPRRLHRVWAEVKAVNRTTLDVQPFAMGEPARRVTKRSVFALVRPGYDLPVDAAPPRPGRGFGQGRGDGPSKPGGADMGGPGGYPGAVGCPSGDRSGNPGGGSRTRTDDLRVMGAPR